MTLWMVERYLPAPAADRLAELAAQTGSAVRDLAGRGVAIAYLGSTAVAEDETCFCLFESDSVAAVEQVNAAIAAPCVRIVEAVRPS
jgi:hypothetical protein